MYLWHELSTFTNQTTATATAAASAMVTIVKTLWEIMADKYCSKNIFNNITQVVYIHSTGEWVGRSVILPH